MKKVLSILIVSLISHIAFAQTKIDEYGKLISDDEGGRLYGVSQHYLKNNKNSKIYILINKEQKMPFGRFLRYFYGVERWFIWLNVPKESIVLVAGEEKDKQSTQIWFIKNNENSPIIDSKFIEEKLQGKLTEKTLFDMNCIECDESPFIKQFIFREGIDNLAKVLKANLTSMALLKIARVEYLSRTVKERRGLTKQIFDRLKSNGVEKNRVSIQFTSGMNASFYIVPKMVKIKKS